MPKRYQTISQFMFSPFFNTSLSNMSKDRSYNLKYSEFIRTNKIHIKAVLSYESSFYYLIKIPSESSTGTLEYDVVIRFFPKDPEIMTEPSVRNYYIQFFSNSPSFTYKFAYVYNKHGYLIKDLVNKMDEQFINVPPKTTNKDQSLSYDKSIYFACKFLAEGKFRWLNKHDAMTFYGTSSPEKFFSLVNSDKALNYSRILAKTEENLKKELAKKPTNVKEKKEKNRAITRMQNTIFNIKTSGHPKITGKPKVKSGGKIAKISSKRSTKK